jgi:hypothetical protein
MLIEKTRLPEFGCIVIVHQTQDNVTHHIEVQLAISISAFPIRMLIVAATVLNTRKFDRI